MNKTTSFLYNAKDNIAKEGFSVAVYRRIRDLREDHDLTQSALAAQLGLPQRSYSYYETGQHMMPLEILRALARFYGVSTDYLLELTDDPTPPPPPRNAEGK